MPTRRPEQRRIKRSLVLDPDQVRWLESQAARQDVSESHVIRQIIRAAMNAESRINDADTEQ
jgi:hypothetical protein